MIAQTLAFVQSVVGTNEDAGAPLPRLTPKQPTTTAAPVDRGPVVTTRAAEPPHDLTMTPASRPIVPSDLRSEIGARIASFRAHQERFNRERADYCNATLAKACAATDDAPPRRPRQ
ncbi:MAG: hypothetical protein ACREDL_07790 [Bradyrhizobium sp.]